MLYQISRKYEILSTRNTTIKELLDIDYSMKREKNHIAL